MAENDFLRWLQRQPQQPHTVLGIGDDAALTRLSHDSLLVSCTDTVLDGVHFELNETEPFRIGHKALAVNLSDIAAMGATPRSALIALTVPHSMKTDQLHAIYQGMSALASKFQVDLVGGDTTSWKHPLVISITVIGELLGQPWLRKHAVPGDQLVVSGQLGGSLLGKHLDFEPRVRLAAQIHALVDVHAAIDISDGLGLDSSRIADASGVQICLEESAIPISSAAIEMAARDHKTPLEHALSDGEDFELLIALAPAAWKELQQVDEIAAELTRVGECRAGSGLVMMHPDGSTSKLKPGGYEHRFDSE